MIDYTDFIKELREAYLLPKPEFFDPDVSAGSTQLRPEDVKSHIATRLCDLCIRALECGDKAFVSWVGQSAAELIKMLNELKSMGLINEINENISTICRYTFEDLCQRLIRKNTGAKSEHFSFLRAALRELGDPIYLFDTLKLYDTTVQHAIETQLYDPEIFSAPNFSHNDVATFFALGGILDDKSNSSMLAPENIPTDILQNPFLTGLHHSAQRDMNYRAPAFELKVSSSAADAFSRYPVYYAIEVITAHLFRDASLNANEYTNTVDEKDNYFIDRAFHKEFSELIDIVRASPSVLIATVREQDEALSRKISEIKKSESIDAAYHKLKEAVNSVTYLTSREKVDGVIKISLLMESFAEKVNALGKAMQQRPKDEIDEFLLELSEYLEQVDSTEWDLDYQSCLVGQDLSNVSTLLTNLLEMHDTRLGESIEVISTFIALGPIHVVIEAIKNTHNNDGIEFGMACLSNRLRYFDLDKICHFKGMLFDNLVGVYSHAESHRPGILGRVNSDEVFSALPFMDDLLMASVVNNVNREKLSYLRDIDSIQTENVDLEELFSVKPL